MTTQKEIKEQWKKLGLKINKELRDIIHGYIMSDGYVKPDGSLQIEQSLKQEKFVEWLYERFEILRTENSKITLVSRTDKRNNKETQSKRFYTKSILKGYHKMWYESYVNQKGDTCYKKRLPRNMKGFFNSTFITLWFAGDGTKMLNQRGAKFEVTAFTNEERQQLKQLFKEKFGINAVINRAGQSKTGKTQWALCINSPDYDKFRTLITQIDLIPNLFPDKLHSAKI